MSITTNAEAIAVNTLLREVYQLEGTTFARSWDERPEPDDVKAAAKLMAKAAHKKLMAGIMPRQIEDADLRAFTEEELAEMHDLFEKAGI